MKVAIIGGGSTYTPELINGLLDRMETFPLTELWLMDIDPERLDIVGGFAQRMVAAKEAPFKVILTQNQTEAVKNSSYVITQLRVGKMEARRADEYLGRRHGLIGQETTGIGGMAKALRTIPVILQIAEDMRSLAPGALLVNFTNPSGLVTEALNRLTPDVPTVGVCNNPITFKMEILKGIAKLLGENSPIKPGRAELITLGLNHLSWHRGFILDGKDIWPRVLEFYLANLKSKPDPEWDTNTIEALGMIPNSYLQYYYYTAQKLAAQQKWPPSRAEVVMEVEKELLREYANPELKEPPADLMKRGGAYYSTVAIQLLNSHYNNLGEILVVNVRHNGAVAGWPSDWVLEMPCRVDRSGIHPLAADPLPPVCFGLLSQVKFFELIMIDAATHGDRKALYQALLAHPLGPDADQAQAVMNDLLETNRTYLPQFYN